MNLGLLVIILVIFVLILIVLFISLEFQVLYRKDWNQKQSDISVKLSFLWGRGRIIPWANYIWMWIREENTKGAEEINIKETIKEWSGDPLKFINQIWTGWERQFRYIKYIEKIMSRSKVKQLRWITEVGLLNPMETALTAGALWWLKDWIFSGIKRRTSQSLTECKIRVIPNYQGKSLKINFYCLFEARINQLVMVGLKSLVS